MAGRTPKVAAPPEEMRNLIAYLRRLGSEPGVNGTLAVGELGPGVSFADVEHPNPGSWPTYDGNQSGNRFSPLSQIDTRNVERLAPKWMFTLQGAPRALEVTPLVVDGVMYVTTVNEAYALDARSGREIWHYSRPRSQGMAGDAASGINRGVAVLGDRVFMVSDNAHLFALHRFTGQLIWDVEMADSRRNYGSTGAPLAVNDLVVTGVSGGDEGVRGFLDAYKASTGERVWRFWTIPAAGEPGSESWIGRALEHGCGATWLTGTYDPEARLLYWPTGNPCPDYNGDERKGDNLYTASVLALDPATGKLKWYYQFTPHDLHDWDATETPVLVDAQFRGQPRKLMLQGNRNGFFYVLDRLTGKVLLAAPFVSKITWASGIGPDGRPQLLPGNEPTVEGQLVCPAVAGAANWPSSAYSPVTGLFYMFAEESCNIYSKNDQWWEAGKSFYGGGTRRAPSPPGPDGKFLKAIDIQTGKTAWEIPDVGGGILASGLMATAGGLIFYGDGSGAFVAADAANGKPLWHFNTGQTSKAGPMTYTIDGNQYIGVAAGSTILAFGVR
jgi:alcohol dehydrogenase (cytochrome c)